MNFEKMIFNIRKIKAADESTFYQTVLVRLFSRRHGDKQTLQIISSNAAQTRRSKRPHGGVGQYWIEFRTGQ